MAILQNKFVREDGSIIGSSVIISCKYTSDVNSQTNLTVGDVTADEVEVEIRTPAVSITAGEKLTYYQIEDGVENLIGVFYAEAPTVATKTSIRFNAYDGKAKLAADFSEWLNANQDRFPMTLRTLVGHACETAGVPLAADSFQFDSLSIPAFYAQGVTCRQIVSWAAQIAGRFVSCNTAGEIFFDWYRKSSVLVSAKRQGSKDEYSFSIVGKNLILDYQGDAPRYSVNDDGHLVLEYAGQEPDVFIDKNGHLAQLEKETQQYRLDSLSKKDYSTDTIRRVQFKQETNDVGVIYPADADGNVFSISRNGIAAVLDSDTLRTIAQYLYEKLKSVSYVPLSFKLSRTASIRAGDIISVTDGNGNTVNTYVMKVYLDSSGTQISSTGDQNYADKAAVSSEQYRNIPGKVLLLEKSVDGLRISAADTAGRVSKLELTADGFSVEVSNANERSKEALEKAEKAAADLGEFSNSVTGGLTDLQNQIDGAIETWFDNYEPTTTNAPASSWATTEDKNKHLGDLFYIIDNKDKGGLVYRWALTNGVYGWVLVEDTEVAKALETASKAKDTADGKRRVFVAQPKPPYDVGDLWTNNTDLYVCQTARAEGSYTASDWKLATEYTTESKVKALIRVSEEGILMQVGEASGKADKAIISTKDQFYQSTSPTSLTGGSWQDVQPPWRSDTYIFLRRLNTYGDGTTGYTPNESGVCITGNTGATGDKGDKGDKGNAGADGSDGVSVKEIVRYYCLTSNGKPEKPTVYPPSDIWSLEEPSYKSGSKDVLYYVDASNFTNWVTVYSEVQISSSYEAAKEAWDKAREANNNAYTYYIQNKEAIGMCATKEYADDIADDVTALKVTAKGVDMTSEDSNGKLVSFIGNRDTGGVWKAEYTKNGSVTSALYFDFAKGSFVFDGHVVARSGEIGGCLIVGGNLQVPAANITDKLTARQIDATDLHVKAANIDGKLTFGSAYYIDPSATTNYLMLPGLEITSSGASFTGAIKGGSININDRFKVDSSGNVTLPSGTSITWGMLPSGVASTGEIPTSVSELTNDSGYQTSTQVESAITGKGYQTASQVNSAITSKGYQTAAQVTTITENTIATTNVVAQYLHVKAANIDGVLTADKIDAESLVVRGANVEGPLSSNMIYVPGSLAYTDYSKGGTWIDGSGLRVYNSSKFGMNYLDFGITYSDLSNGISYIPLIFGENTTTAGGYWTFSGKITSFTVGTQSSSYRIEAVQDKLSFYYSTTRCGLIETYMSYVNIVGTWRTNGSAWITSSDARLKNTIEDFTPAHDVLFDNLRPRTYKWNEGTSDRTHSGFIVQEVVEAVEKSGLTTKDFAAVVNFKGENGEDDGWGLRYEEMISLNTWQIQKLKARIAELEGRLKYETN